MTLIAQIRPVFCPGRHAVTTNRAEARAFAVAAIEPTPVRLSADGGEILTRGQTSWLFQKARMREVLDFGTLCVMNLDLFFFRCRNVKGAEKAEDPKPVRQARVIFSVIRVLTTGERGKERPLLCPATEFYDGKMGAVIVQFIVRELIANFQRVRVVLQIFGSRKINQA